MPVSELIYLLCIVDVIRPDPRNLDSFVEQDATENTNQTKVCIRLES